MLGAPTGSGKTVIAASIILDAVSRGKIAMFIVDRIQLCKQASELLESLGLSVTIYQGDNTLIQPDHQAIVASVQTLANRRLPVAELMLIDEAHIFHEAHEKIMSTYDNLPVLGMSATPMRKGLGLWFDTLVRAPSAHELVQLNRLVPMRCYDPYTPDTTAIPTYAGDFSVKHLTHLMNNPTLIGNVVNEWQRLGGNRPTICFAVDIAHSKAIVRRFNEAGIPAAHLDAYSDDIERKRAIDQLRAGDIKILSSVAVLSIGFNEPCASCVIMARPTKSANLFIQQAGRVMRTYPGKDDCILLDHAGNINRIGYLPQRYRIPNLNDSDNPRKKATPPDELKPARCKICLTLLEPIDTRCPVCQTERNKPTTVVEIDGELSLIAEPIPQREKNRFYQELLFLCHKYNKKPGYAYYLYTQKYKEKPMYKPWDKVPHVEASQNTINWYKHHQVKNHYRRKKHAA